MPRDPSPTPGRALLRAGCACCGGCTGAPGLGVPIAWGWGALGWVLTHARPPVLGPCGRGPIPTGCARGGCVCGDPSPTPRRALLRAGCACCRGGMGAPGVMTPVAWVWGALGPALSHARLLVIGACGRGPLPTGCGCGGFRPGDLSPTRQRALLCAGLALCGGGKRAPQGVRLLPGCGASLIGRSPRPDRPSLGRAAGARYPLAVGPGGLGLGTRQQPHSGHSCVLAWRSVGAARGRPRGYVFCLDVGRPWLGVHPRPSTRPCGVRPGPATHWLPLRGLWAWEPVTNPTARALASWLCALSGRQEGAGGSIPCLGEGRPGLGAPPRPTASPCSVRPRPATHLLRVRGVWAWRLVTNPKACAFASWLCALWGRHEGARGGRLLPGCGAPWVGRSPTPDHLSMGRAAGAHYKIPAGAGGVGVETCHQSHGARSCELSLGAVGGAQGRPRGGALVAWVWGVWVGRSVTPDRPSFGSAARARYPLAAGGGGVGVGTGHQPHSLRSCVLALRVVRAARGRPGGCVSCLDMGRPGLGTHPRQTACPWGVRPGPATHWLRVGGLPLWGTCHQPHSARSCKLAMRAAGAARGRPSGERLLPGCGASVVGRSPMPDRGSLGRVAGTRYPLAVGAMCGPGGPAVCGTFSCAALCPVLCALPWVSGTRWPLLLGTCPRAVAVAGGVPLCRTPWPRVGAPRLVWSGRSRCSGRLSRCPGAVPHPGGFRPQAYWAADQGTGRPAEDRALCACRWPLQRQGRSARSALYPVRALRWGCSWRVPPASVLGCVRCGCLACVDPVTDASGFPHCRLSTGYSADAPGLFRVDANTSPFGSHDATPESRVCVLVRAPLWPRQAGLPLGRVLVRLTFRLAVLYFFLVRLPQGWGCPCLDFSFLLFSFPLARRLLPAFCASRPWVLWALTLFVCSAPPPPPLFYFPFLFFFQAPPCLGFSFVSGPGCPGPVRFVAARPPPPLSLFVFVFLFFNVPAFLWFPPLCATAPPAWVSFSSSVCGLACGVCAVCWG